MSSPQPGDDDGADASPAAAASTALVQRVYKKHRPSVVQVAAIGIGYGTGFVVHNDGSSCLILTCAHIFETTEPRDPRDLQVSLGFEGVEGYVSAGVIRMTEERDFALLRVLGVVPSSCAPLEFSDEVDLSGREVVALGFFGVDASSMCIDPGSPYGHILSESFVARAPKGSDFFECIVCNFSSTNGMSGGPVIMEDEVVGIFYRLDAGLSVAITVATLKSVLKGWTQREQDPNITIGEMLQLIADEGEA